MDDRRFDHVIRSFGGAATRRSAVVALVGLLAGGTSLDAKAKGRRRRKCDPACPAGQTCRRGACACDGGRAPCGGACCPFGQACRDGTCRPTDSDTDPAPAPAEPTPSTCRAVAQPCAAGAPCCAGLACESGACRVPAGGACRADAECADGTACRDGVCVVMASPVPDADAGPVPPPPPAPAPDPSGCVPAVAVTGDPTADGAALAAALATAEGRTGTTLFLAAGGYRLPVGEDGIGVAWRAGDVALQPCPGAEGAVAISGSSPGMLFDVRGGGIALRDLELIGPYSTDPSSCAAAVTLSGETGDPAATLERCTARGFAIALWAFVSRPASLTVIGGDYRDNVHPLSGQANSLQAAGVAVTCAEGPRMGGCAFVNLGWNPECGCACDLNGTSPVDGVAAC